MNDLDTRLRHMAREEETPVPKDFDENLTRTLARLPARKRRRIPRAVLLAACLVLVLTGAVLAAESGVFARFGTPGDPNTEGLFYDGTKYGGTWTYSTDRRLNRKQKGRILMWLKIGNLCIRSFGIVIKRFADQ